MGYIELYIGVHTAQRQTPIQMPIGFCTSLSVCVSVSVSVSMSGSVDALLCTKQPRVS